MAALTGKETQIVQVVKQQRVVTSTDLMNQVGVSQRTVRRALIKYGYYVSVNANAAYLTLRDIPRFDASGLWCHDQICFSRHGTLASTIAALVHQSPTGQTVGQLADRLHTHVHNQLSTLLRTHQLSRVYVGRHALYLSADGKRQTQQLAQRSRESEPEQTTGSSAPRRGRQLPRGLNALSVIRLLIQMIETPKASVASLTKRLQAQGVTINAEQVRSVIEFYSLGKKTKR